MRRVDFVYFIQAGEDGPIKIGRTNDVPGRLAGLQVGNHVPLRLLVATERAAESDLHALFEPYHIRGEWFSPCVELLDVIAAFRSRQYYDPEPDPEPVICP